MSDAEIKEQVRQFYDQVGWQIEAGGIYQNARYEDLRPVSQEYILRCHQRVSRHLPKQGRYLLDAGSGPVQYDAYEAYSQTYQYRVCADLSIVALRAARRRLGSNGLYVVADIARLPFASSAFDGLVSLHTLHHLPPADHAQSYAGLYRVLKPGGSGVVVNGWTESPLMRWAQVILKPLEIVLHRRTTKTGSPARSSAQPDANKPSGTFIQKYDPRWLKEILKGRRYQILVWRSVSVNFLRTAIHARLAGRFLLRLLYAFEERFPRFFGEKGQYPLIVIHN